MKKFIKDILTQSDGESYCGMRLMVIVGALAFIIITLYSITKGGSFDPQNWGIGYGSLVVGGGGGLWAKSKAEPEQ